MMKIFRSFLLLALFYFSSSSFSQVVFEKHYNVYYSQRFSDVICKSDGNFILSGTCFPAPDERRPWISEIDSTGDMLWEKSFINEHRYEIHSITPLGNSGYLLCGVQYPLEIFDPDTFYVYKTNLSGDSIWSKAYFDGYAYDAIEIEDDTSIVVGQNNDQACALKLSPEGSVLKSEVYNEINFPYSLANSIIRLSDSLFLITGGIGNDDNYYSYYVFVDKNLNKKWSSIFTDYPDVAGIKTIVADNFLYTLCQSYGETGLHPIIKSDSLGNLIWARTIYYCDTCWPTSFTIFDDFSFYITGYKYQNLGGGAFLARTDSSANKIWQRNYGNQTATAFYTIENSNDNLLIAAGQDLPSAYLIKADTNGTIVSTLESPPVKNDLILYPNPFSDKLVIISHREKIKRVQFYDPMGRMLEDFKINDASKTTLEPKGTYHGILFIYVQLENTKHQNFKVLRL